MHTICKLFLNINVNWFRRRFFKNFFFLVIDLSASVNQIKISEAKQVTLNIVSEIKIKLVCSVIRILIS